MWLINWWKLRKERKQQKLLKLAKQKEEAERQEEEKRKRDAKNSLISHYLNRWGLNHDRDFAVIDKMIGLVGDKYVKEVELLLSSTGNGEYLSDKITNEDIPKMVSNIMENLSNIYKTVLCIYLGDEDGIMRYIILKLNESIVKIMLLNRHKINSMNPEYRKLQQLTRPKPQESTTQQR